MKPYFLFPADPLNKKLIDEAFRDQAKAMDATGYNYALVNLEDDSIYLGFGQSSTPFKQDSVVYRGWMLSEAEYTQLGGLVDFYGGKLLTSKEQYYATHHIPNWYDKLADVTAPTMTFPCGLEGIQAGDLWRTIQDLGWKKAFMKDYVKSLKTDGGSVVETAGDLIHIYLGMQKYRGLIEGGICLRKFEEYIPQTEIRYFVRDGKAYAPKVDHNISLMMMSGQTKLADEVARRIPSPFFSVDIAMRADFEPRVIECGDGQVSDLVGWTPEEFATIWT